MNIFYAAYITLSSFLFMLLFPFFFLYSRITGRFKSHLNERLGFIRRETVRPVSRPPRIWIHAVSLGEVKVADSIIEKLRRIMPDCSLIVSTTTEHGRNLAKETFGDEIPVIYAPIDFIGSVRKSLFTVRPHAVVFLETEIWPVWLFEAHRMGIKTALVNGRISPVSIKKYLKIRPLIGRVLRKVDVFSMILKQDAERIMAMGADPAKIQINGNAKYELLGRGVDPAVKKEMRQLLNLDASRQVFIAGSTRDGEETMLIDAYNKILKEFPDTILIISPRHIERTKLIESLVKSRGLTCRLRTDLGKGRPERTEQVVIINTFGELSGMYGIGTIVFCGGSLVPLGGQNPLEAAVWGKAVFYGPSMENFLDAKALLEKAGAAIPVRNPEDLAEKAIRYLDQPGLLEEKGRRGMEAVQGIKGAAEKQAGVIKRLVESRRGSA